MANKKFEIAEFIDALNEIQQIMQKKHPNDESIQLYIWYKESRKQEIELRLWPDGTFKISYYEKKFELPKKIFVELKANETGVRSFHKELHSRNTPIKDFWAEWVESLKTPRIPNGKELSRVLSTL